MELIGGLFKDLKQDYIEHRLNDRIIALMVDFARVLEFYVGNDKADEITSSLISYSDELGFVKNFTPKIKPLKSAA
ncbi:MAG: hypothetical protein KAG96_03775 [Ichthyobacteriaceae bacterium]|nr:hypothetical protein [Ichthyobacteriaceae bacterium]